ncbi:MAG: hypothetical protein ACLFPE_16230, partial [Bacteroidales bacterium]
MKKSFTLVLCLALLIPLSAVKGQNGARNTQSLLTEGNTWSVVECTGLCTSYYLKIEGDTILNGNLYKKLVRSNDSLQSNWYFEAALRQDADGKIWRRDGSSESLYYDFGLEAGDMFSTSVNGCQIDMQVESVETITLLNGEQRTKINFQSEESWIEGIGSTLGMSNMGKYQCWFDIYFYLNCFTEDGITKYDDPAWDGCFHYSVGMDEPLQKSAALLNAYPNPASDFVIVSYSFDTETEGTIT